MVLPFSDDDGMSWGSVLGECGIWKRGGHDGEVRDGFLDR